MLFKHGTRVRFPVGSWQSDMYKKLNLHLLFEAGVILKGIHAFVELVAAVFLYYFGNATFLAITRLAESELAEDPNDAFLNFVLNQSGHLVSARGFVALYLVISALINLAIAAGLLSNRMHAYPASIAVLCVFVLYQAYRLTLTHSAWLLAFTIFDIIVIFLIYEEYKRQKELRATPVAEA